MVTFYSQTQYQPGFRLIDGSQLNFEEGNPKFTVDSAVTATGSTVVDAYPLTGFITVLSTVATGTGVLLPHGIPGTVKYVFNAGGAAVHVYAQSSELVDGAASVTLTNALRCGYYCVSPGVWVSAQMGAVSA